MTKKSNKLEFLNQAELAEHLGVDRTTVGTWIKKGLPCIKGERGKPHSFHFACSFWWMLGKEFMEDSRWTGLNAAQQIIFARAVADEATPGEDLAGEKWMVPMLANVGIPELTVIREVAFVKGLMAGRKKRANGKQRG